MWDKDNSVVYFILHLPRTAGTTIKAHLQTHMAKERFWVLAKPSHIGMRRRQPTRLDNAPDLSQIRAVTGEWIGRSLERHFPGREIRRALLLRDPIGFHVSYYNFLMMFGLCRGRRPYTFYRYLRTMPRDLVAISLLWQWLELPIATMLSTSDQQKYKLLSEALAGFWFVADYQYCDRLIAAIAGDLAVPPIAQRRNSSLFWQKRVAWEPLRVDDLPASAREAILARNPIHQALWQGWRNAGFDAARVQPPPFAASPNGRFSLREAVRAGVFAAGELRPKPIWRTADLARDSRQWRRAALLYRKALQRFPEFPELWVQYGHALKESGNVAAAEDAYREALRLDAENGDTHLQMGHALKLQGRTEAAAAAYLEALTLDPALVFAAQELEWLGWTPARIDAALRRRAGAGDRLAGEPVSGNRGWG